MDIIDLFDKDWESLGCARCGSTAWVVQRLPAVKPGGTIAVLYEGGTPAIRYRFVCHQCNQSKVYLDDVENVPRHGELSVPSKTSVRTHRIDSAEAK